VFLELGWLVIRIGGARGTAWFSDISGFTAPAVAAILCARTARRGRSRAWWVLAGACGSWAAGQMVWSWYELVLGREVPFPSFADLGYLGMYPLALVALILLRGDSARAVSRVRAVLDGLIVGGSVLFAGWAVAIGRVLDQPTVGVAQRVLAVLYPVGDVVLCTAALTLPARSGILRSRTVALVLAGIVGLGVSDLMFTYLTSSGSYATGNVVDAGWFTGFTLIGLAAALAPARAGTGPVDRARRAPRSTWIYLPTLAVIVGEAQPRLDPFLALLGAGVFALVVLRQVASTLENRRLTTDLEVRIGELRDRDEQYRLVLRATRDAIWDLDLATDQIAWGDGIGEVFGYDPADAGHDLGWWKAHIHPDDAGRVAASFADALDRGDTAWSEEYRFLAADGRWVAVMDRGFVVRSGGEPVRVVGAMLDISDRKRYETELAQRALHDPLTGLPNRALLLERIRAAVEGGRGDQVGLLFLDLDHFKRINDSFGHSVGDDVLVEVGRRLTDVVRAEDVVSRFGGDEFVILCAEAADEPAARRVVDRLLAALALPFEVGGRRLHLSASVGVALGRDVDREGTGFLQSADTALYEAKARGRARCAVFNDELGRRVRADLELTEALRAALGEDRLSLAYQPVVDLAGRQPVGIEALVRWQHDGAWVAPSLFVRLAEEAGLIDELGDWVLRRSCQEVAGWRLPPTAPFTLSVNLSPLQLGDGLPGRVAAALDATGLAPHRLCLEITEGALMRNRRTAMRALKRVRALGVRVAIDDFGTGSSSLSYLNRLPVDILKIDRVFVADLVQGGRRRAITEAVVGIARAAGLTVVAEGVEGEAQAEALRRLGCAHGQGYLFGRPQPGDEVRARFHAATPTTIG